jgi:hypothetical protein
MATKATPAAIQISSESKDWGTRLIVKPFMETHAGMEVSAEIAKPRAGRSAEIKFCFSGVPGHNPLRSTELIVWLEAVKAVHEEARRIGDEMKNGKPKKKKKS